MHGDTCEVSLDIYEKVLIHLSIHSRLELPTRGEKSQAADGELPTRGADGGDLSTARNRRAAGGDRQHERNLRADGGDLSREKSQLDKHNRDE